MFVSCTIHHIKLNESLLPYFLFHLKSKVRVRKSISLYNLAKCQQTVSPISFILITTISSNFISLYIVESE